MKKNVLIFSLFASVVFSSNAETIPYLQFSSECKTSVFLPVSGLEYSLDGSSWVNWTAQNEATALSFGGSLGNLQLRGKLTQGTGDKTLVFDSSDEQFQVSCSGDIRTLIDYENYASADCSQAIFKSLFMDCKTLVSAPELPIMELSTGCYETMFKGCTSLVSAPSLPANELAVDCYLFMFENCTSLKNVPSLSATQLKNHCYSGMFSGCSALEKAPDLLAIDLDDACYKYMFLGCSSLTKAPSILPAMSLKKDCYGYMFFGCTSLEIAPELPALSLVQGCYQEMFEDCEKISYIKMLATDITAEACMDWWVSGVAHEGTFIKNSNAKWEKTGVSGIPSNWTIETFVGIKQIVNPFFENNTIVNVQGQPTNADSKTINIKNGKKYLIR